MEQLAMVPNLFLSETPHHHGSHRHLLAQHRGNLSRRSAVDAIIVPTARRSENLRHAVALATHHRCTLVALCSRQASAKAAKELALGSGVEMVAVNVAGIPANLLPSFETTRLLLGTPFQRQEDTSPKRNFGLLLAAVAGWQRIVFLDDDIDIRRSDDLLDAASLLDDHDAVGLSPGGFPDNSVVCHAYRDAGGRQDTFIGGGALAVKTASIEAFFPKIYNEDWFFLLDNTRLRNTALIGHAAQRPYNPYRTEQRARAEEFGDCLAEGLFWLLDRGRRVKDADSLFWRRFLHNRRQFIDEVIGMTWSANLDAQRRVDMIAALKAARGWNGLIDPRLCVSYLRAWRADRRRWRRHVAEYQNAVRLHPQKVLSELGLMHCGEYLPASDWQTLDENTA